MEKFCNIMEGKDLSILYESGCLTPAYADKRLRQDTEQYIFLRDCEFVAVRQHHQYWHL